MYVLPKAWVGASMCSWPETVRLTGFGKKGGGEDGVGGGRDWATVNTSPAPSQSDDVRSGVWMWVNSCSCRQPTLPVHLTLEVGLTSNQSCQSRANASRTLIVAALAPVRNRKCAYSLNTLAGSAFF